MTDYKKTIVEMLSKILTQISEEEIGELIEIPADSSMGDFAFPCFKLAKIMRKSPQAIAAETAGKLGNSEKFDKIAQVGAYINFYVSRSEFIRQVVVKVLNEGENFGKSQRGKGRKVLVEFSSPNIAKPFHIGHIRSTVIGNSIQRIYSAMGYDVVRINHLGDYGTQFGKMICAYRRWGNREDVEREPIKTLLSYYMKFHKEAEHDESLEEEARKIFVDLENGKPEELELWQWFRDESLKEFRRVYDMLDIEFDSYAGESFYSDKMPAILKKLNESGLLKESEGAQIVDLEEYGMSPALIKKSDGSTLYITRDIAAAVYRKNYYDFYKNIYVVASQQNLHFRQWIKIIELMGYEWANDCVHIPFGLVSLEEGTMSTREGRVVFLEDVLNKAVEQTKKIIEEKGVATQNIEQTAKDVGIGAVIFQELSNNRIKDYVFSWDKVLNFDGETGPYVQYTHARACSLIAKIGEQDAERAGKAEGFSVDLVDNDNVFYLIKDIEAFEGVIAEAAEKYEPAVITRHIVDIAQKFNRFYNNERINVENEPERLTKAAVVLAAMQTIKNGLALLGVKAPEKM